MEFIDHKTARRAVKAGDRDIAGSRVRVKFNAPKFGSAEIPIIQEYEECKDKLPQGLLYVPDFITEVICTQSKAEPLDAALLTNVALPTTVNAILANRISVGTQQNGAVLGLSTVFFTRCRTNCLGWHDNYQEMMNPQLITLPNISNLQLGIVLYFANPTFWVRPPVGG